MDGPTLQEWQRPIKVTADRIQQAMEKFGTKVDWSWSDTGCQANVHLFGQTRTILSVTANWVNDEISYTEEEDKALDLLEDLGVFTWKIGEAAPPDQPPGALLCPSCLATIVPAAGGRESVCPSAACPQASW